VFEVAGNEFLGQKSGAVQLEPGYIFAAGVEVSHGYVSVVLEKLVELHIYFLLLAEAIE
jgi:hypothetical protein